MEEKEMTMFSNKTYGIVIRRMNYGEADRILTIFTERFGKIKAIAKGVRKTKSHLSGSLEPFMLLDLQLHEGKTFYIVTGASIKEDFSFLHEDLKKMSQAFYLGELLDKFLVEHQKSPKIFDLCLKALKSINDNSSGFMLRAYELKIVEASGFHPELYNCVHCKEKLVPENNFWDAVEGGVVCKKCQAIYRQGVVISDEIIKYFRFIETNDLQKIEKLKLSKKLQEEAENILSNYMQNILERELKTTKFLKKCSG